MSESVPPLAPWPPATICEKISSADWETFLDTWILGIETRLRLSPEKFGAIRFSDSSSGYTFLLSYFPAPFSTSTAPTSSLLSRPAAASSNLPSDGNNMEAKLRRRCLLLLRRLLLESKTLIDCPLKELFSLLANASVQFRTNKLWRATLGETWRRIPGRLESAVEEEKGSFLRAGNSGDQEAISDQQQQLMQFTALMCCLPQVGSILMAGSEYLDSLVDNYNQLLSAPMDHSVKRCFQKVLIENLFLGLQSLMKDTPSPSPSLLLDSLYTLKIACTVEDANTSSKTPTLLSDLLCSTSFEQRLRAFLTSSLNSRGSSLLEYLLHYKEQKRHLHSQHLKTTMKQPCPGKSKATAVAHEDHEMHIHTASQVSQIQDLFPDLSAPYVMRLLDYFSGDVEAVTASLLEPESLPADLQDRAKYSDYPTRTAYEATNAPKDRKSSDRPSTERRNVFDGDAFDRRQISASQVHRGHKNQDMEEDIGPSERAKKKAAIMAALAAFDSDEDERDDTYDIADVGGAIDGTVDTDERPHDKISESNTVNEQKLYNAWTSNPELFSRESKTRLTQPRQQLKSETGMTDEQIEGWALMLSEDSGRQRNLEHRYAGPASFRGQQTHLATSKWSAARNGTAEGPDSASHNSATTTTSGMAQDASRLTGEHRQQSANNLGRDSGHGGQHLAYHNNANTHPQGRGRGGRGGRGRRGKGGAPNHNRRDRHIQKMAGGGT